MQEKLDLRDLDWFQTFLTPFSRGQQLESQSKLCGRDSDLACLLLVSEEQVWTNKLSSTGCCVMMHTKTSKLTRNVFGGIHAFAVTQMSLK